jgi:hypothetical protein
VAEILSFELFVPLLGCTASTVCIFRGQAFERSSRYRGDTFDFPLLDQCYIVTDALEETCNMSELMSIVLL